MKPTPVQKVQFVGVVYLIISAAMLWTIWGVAFHSL